jgi:predicted DNA-binding transcriptional regulator YafY
MPEIAARQLERVLYVLPTAARDGGARLPELARALGCSEPDVLALISEVTARAFYQPGGTVDAFEVLVSGDRVSVHTTGEFRRPVRLTQRESLALSLGLRSLAAERAGEEREAVLALALRLEAGLRLPELPAAALEADVRPSAEPASYASVPADEADEVELELGADDLRSLLADAVRDRRLLRITYLKPGTAGPSQRDVEPWVLAYAEGSWYTIAREAGQDRPKIFRLDRVLSAAVLSDSFMIPADFSPAAFVNENGGLFAASGSTRTRVRYSPKVARWVAERVAHERLSDGSIVVEHRVADPQWLWRHVLMYGGEAVVVG